MTVASASLGTLSSLRARKQEEPSPRSKPSWAAGSLGHPKGGIPGSPDPGWFHGKIPSINGGLDRIPSGNDCYKKLLKMIIEIVDFPIKHGGSFHSYM